jgi:hypothetical protein
VFLCSIARWGHMTVEENLAWDMELCLSAYCLFHMPRGFRTYRAQSSMIPHAISSGSRFESSDHQHQA